MTSWSRLVSSASADIGIDGALHRDDLAALEVGPRCRSAGCRLTYCSPITDRSETAAAVSAGIFGAEQLSMSRSTCTPFVEQVQRADPADRDAAVGDLGVAEDAAGVGEVGVDRAGAAAEEALEQPDVVRAHVGHAEQGDEDEQRSAGSWCDRLIIGRITRPSPTRLGPVGQPSRCGSACVRGRLRQHRLGRRPHSCVFTPHSSSDRFRLRIDARFA